jgi:hypothetical protein
MASGTSGNIEIQTLAADRRDLLTGHPAIAYKNGSIDQKSMQNLQNDLSLLFYFRHIDCSDHVDTVKKNQGRT